MFYVHILVQRFKTYLKPPVVVDIVDDVGVHVHVDVVRLTILEISKLLFAPGWSDANSSVTGDSWPQNA